ncbi:hypothetical protein COCVIDRAFT_96677 [Bipolaris victoriae FI3]|uniref:Zn(2)-C6 fungal-type domain-containing protein n=1 Tax=Bipolaris victoriae (strain FI3) TaxID=930091 RepID=W7EM69_BIPV3|nr:hypothetical protein COCVIDRAFT_96677 [Bipolaris victoriae FI3]
MFQMQPSSETSNLVQPEQNTFPVADLTAEGPRNRPRVSHACQRCRVKKAKCDQQQPCLNCVKHAADCEYGIKRRSRQKKKQDYRSANETPSTPMSPGFATGSQTAPHEGELQEPPRDTALSDFAPQALSTNTLDVVGDINQRTQGTEFYGTSSNFVLLNQLFSFARQNGLSGYVRSDVHESTTHLFPTSNHGHNESHAPSENHLSVNNIRNGQPDLRSLSQDRVSIINILSNEEVPSPPSRPKTPPHVASDRQAESSNTAPNYSCTTNRRLGSTLCEGLPAVPQSTRPAHTVDAISSPCHITVHNVQDHMSSSTQALKRRLEKFYINVFFQNLHYIHPMLDPVQFEERCGREMWARHTTTERSKRYRHFAALYNIVVAVGALIADRNVLEDLGQDMQTYIAGLAEPERRISSQTISRMYFRQSKNKLGDTYAVCSLESAQTLLLMSLYCQNSHMPHTCYMYCGQAVRTALAIGLANESMSRSTKDRKAARRTWWCIYSHEIDMSCSSGRRDSLRKPHSYQTPLPLIRNQIDGDPDTSEAEPKSIAMINEMVRYAAILRRISKELYHDAKGLTLSEKSVIAKELDALLSDWKANLPEWLDFGKLSFREEEWAGKVKVVLQLRYLNARILVHRIFLIPSINYNALEMSDHVGLCLSAARETIQLLHEAYTHRHYFRTWWYNSTYTLYAGMIVLYVIMLRATALRSEDLLEDVIKAQNILQSMQEATVALRSAELLREGLDIARSMIQRDAAISVPLPRVHTDRVDDEAQGRGNFNDFGQNFNYCFPETTFAANGHVTDPETLFASLIDPCLLQDFTTGLNDSTDIGTSSFLFNDLDNDRSGVYPTLQPSA